MYRASDGYLLHNRHWMARGAPRAQIVALHGIQSHSGWYTYSSRRLADAGYDVFFLDRRGSGLNCQERGHVIHHERLINDVVQFLSELHYGQQADGQSIPVILTGVSWGGKLAAAVALRRPDLIDALGLLYPGLCPKAQPRLRELVMMRWAEWMEWGGYQLPIPLNDPTLFTHESQWQEFIRRDELALYKVSISFLLASQRLTDMVTHAAERLRVPSLLLLAGHDDIIDNAATKACYERITAEPRRIIEYPEARHTLEFEPDQDRFVDDLLEWLDTALRPGKPRGCNPASSGVESVSVV